MSPESGRLACSYLPSVLSLRPMVSLNSDLHYAKNHGLTLTSQKLHTLTSYPSLKVRVKSQFLAFHEPWIKEMGIPSHVRL